MNAVLQAALRQERRLLLAATGAAVIGAVAGIALLAVSGWFMAAAGIAGLGGVAVVQAFNYLLPSAGIRAAAIARTLARHGERLAGHGAALRAIAEVRSGLFARVAAAALAGHDPGRSGLVANRLGRDAAMLEDAVIRRVGWVGALAAATLSLALVALLGSAAAVVVVATLVAMRLAGTGMAARLLPEPSDRATQAHAVLQADYADHATPCADIAVYALAEPIAHALEAVAADSDTAQVAIAKAEGAILGFQLALAGVGLALITIVAQVAAPRLAMGLLGLGTAYEIWGGLAATDLTRHRLAAAQARIDAMAKAADADAGAGAALSGPVALEIAGHTIAPGARVAIAGPSGCGKTRLIETLVGLRQDAPQHLVVGGHDPRTLGLAGLRSVFALASQDMPILAGTVADTLRLARSGVDEAAMWAALEVACLDEFVRSLPEGLNSWIGPEGARLSGGQRRRLALARALTAQRPWLVLDEPSEGLDQQTEHCVAERLASWLQESGTGLILVSHRPALRSIAQIPIDI